MAAGGGRAWAVGGEGVLSARFVRRVSWIRDSRGLETPVVVMKRSAPTPTGASAGIVRRKRATLACFDSIGSARTGKVAQKPGAAPPGARWKLTFVVEPGAAARGMVNASGSGG